MTRLPFLLGLLLVAATPAAAQTPRHNCSFCHNLHGGSYAQLRDYATSEDLCLSCHGFGGPAQVDRDGVLVPVPKGQVIHNGAKHAQPTSCWNCHNHEGEAGTNLSLIQATMPTPNSGDRAVLFTARTGSHSFADGDASYDGVCEVCHTLTAQHRNDGSAGKHNAAADCVTCHKHPAGFAGGGPCTACHNTAQDNGDGIPAGGRRAVVGEFSRRSHHLQTAPPPDSIPNSDCERCHDQSQHQQGYVRLKNVDGGATVVLTGDPATDATEAAKLTPVCLACHDANGAAGNLIPFSDGVTRPFVDSVKWAVSSHKVGNRSCYGDGASGCHATAHGSLKKDLFAPAGVAPIGPDSAAEQEGFCLSCHDSNGPATSNLATPFAAAIRWVTAAVRGVNTTLNDRHDVQYGAQAASGAKLECTDCHNPHTATAAQRVVTDPDPTDGRTPGTGQVMAGASFLTEFCLDCHDGSYPSSVQGPTTPLTDVRTTHRTDAMGAGSGMPSLKPGYGWAQGDTVACLACHNPHVSGNLFHAVTTVSSKDGTTPVPSDGASYAITDNNIRNTAINGYNWCNTCHTGSMGSARTNCFECHYHGSGRW